MLKTENNSVQKFGFLLLIVASFLRPIINVINVNLFLPSHIIFNAGLSYSLIIILLISYNKIKLDWTGLLIVLLSFYSFLSFLWGSDLRNIIDFLLPFTYYFYCITFIQDKKRGYLIITAVIAGYIIPIIGSSFYIALGFSNSMQVYGMGDIDRKFGIYRSLHMFGHAMLCFSYFYSLFITVIKKPRWFRNLSHGLLVLSLYSLFNSYVRSSYLGTIVFWTSFLSHKRKKYLILLIFFAIVIIFWKMDYFETIFYKADSYRLEKNFEQASSGRTTIWKHQLDLFLRMPVYKKFLGSGLGSEKTGPEAMGTDEEIWNSHNDFISLLMTLGVSGLLLYLMILLSIVWDFIKNSTDREVLTVYMSIIISFSFTAFITNGGIFRHEFHQIFWIIIGCGKIICNYDLKPVEKYSKQTMAI